MTHRFGRLADSEEALSAGANSSGEGAAAIEGDLVARARFLSELGPGEMPSRQDFDFSTLLSSGAYVVPSSHLPTSVVSCFFLRVAILLFVRVLNLCLMPRIHCWQRLRVETITILVCTC